MPVDSKKKLYTAKPLVKGFNFYKSAGNVISISFLKQNDKNNYKSQILPSMKKKLHSVTLLSPVLEVF